MKLIEIYSKLKELKISIFQTKDVAAYFNISINHANKILSRMSAINQIIHIKHGTWIFPETDPLLLPSILTAPFPTYISLQTALFYHDMITQIPNTIYAISLARTHKYQTRIGSISIHHVQPSFFFGYEEINHHGLLKMATPEKALLDIFYLSQTKSRLFHSLPEIELPKNFRLAVANKMINQITSIRKKTLVKNRFYELIDALKQK